MRLDQASSALQKFGNRMFKLVKKLAGAEAQWQPGSGWYRANSDRGVFLYLRFVGQRGRKYPPNSVHLAAKWHEEFADSRVVQGNNWFGSGPSADFSARPDHPEEVVRAESFIRRAFQLHRRGSWG